MMEWQAALRKLGGERRDEYGFVVKDLVMHGEEERYNRAHRREHGQYQDLG